LHFNSVVFLLLHLYVLQVFIYYGIIDKKLTTGIAYWNQKDHQPQVCSAGMEHAA